MKRSIPLLITFLVGLSLILAMFIPHWPFNVLNERFSIFYDLIAVFAFILGGGNLLKVHIRKVQRKGGDWKFSLVTIIGFFLMLGAGLAKIGVPEGLSGDYQANGSLFKYIYDSAFQPLQATMFSLLAFFVASASYRAFRAKTLEATILLVAAFIILLRPTPLGYYLTFWPGHHDRHCARNSLDLVEADSRYRAIVSRKPGQGLEKWPKTRKQPHGMKSWARSTGG